MNAWEFQQAIVNSGGKVLLPAGYNNPLQQNYSDNWDELKQQVANAQMIPDWQQLYAGLLAQQQTGLLAQQQTPKVTPPAPPPMVPPPSTLSFIGKDLSEYQKVTMQRQPDGTWLVVKAGDTDPGFIDRDGALVPLPTKQPTLRTITALKHDYIAALYRPYEAPV